MTRIRSLLLLLYAAPAFAAPAGTPAVTVTVLSVDLSEVGPDSLRAAVRVSASAASSASFRGIFFDSVEINGVPVHVAPLREPVRFRAGEPANDLLDLEVEMSYRELESLAPLRSAVEQGHARVHAGIRAQLELNLFEKLALRTGGAWITTSLDEDVPVSVPGGALGRTAASAVLMAAEPAWQASQLAQEWRRNRSALAERARAEIPGRVVTIETRYRIRSRAGEVADRRSSSLGFLIGRGQVLAPAEALEPWMFVKNVAEALDRGDISIDQSKTEIVATPIGGGTSYSLARKEIRVVRALRGEETGITADSKQRYRVRFRESDSNAVLLEIPALRESTAAVTLADGAPSSATEGDDWRPAALVRVTDDGTPRVWLTAARMENGRYRLRDVVDESAIGSPLWIDGATAGMVQGEESAARVNVLVGKLH